MIACIYITSRKVAKMIFKSFNRAIILTFFVICYLKVVNVFQALTRIKSQELKHQKHNIISMKKLVIILLQMFFAISILAQREIQIIPQPYKIEQAKGLFLLSASTTINYTKNSAAISVAQQLVDLLNGSSGFQFAVSQKANKQSAIIFKLEKTDSDNPESYLLIIKPKQICITASTVQGLFYGMQSLRQLFPAAIESENSLPTLWTLSCCTIKDAPRYAYRGLHLDVSRHFFDKKFILKYIDMMAMYKYNTFHWHLTDDQGWRVEIKKYPLLTTKSAFRKECAGETTGGFFTQDDIKEVVAYAAERFINVIPEIEMPGHTVAVLAAYPELSCSGGPFSVPTTWGIFHDVYCAGNDKTFEFLENVLSEIIPLFPGKYIHIGGDECKKTRWERCIKCQARMKTENLADEHKLQSYFITRIERFLQSKGKQIIGWDEILEGGVSKSATIMQWRGVKGGIKAAKAGNQVIMSPSGYCYFDRYQGIETEEPPAFNTFVPMQQVYAFNPTPSELSAEEAKFIIGGQANVWSEYIPTTQQVEYMVFPRALAMSECLWSKLENKNYDYFVQKVHGQYDRMSRYGINFSKSADRASTKDKWLKDQERKK
jgi:hexosaminidase